MIQVKTSAKCAGCVAKIAEQLNTFLTPEQWSIDLSSPDKLLTVKADVSAEKVVEAVRAARRVRNHRICDTKRCRLLWLRYESPTPIGSLLL